MNSILSTPIKFLDGIGEKNAEYLLKYLNISTYKDLLHYFPYKLIDRSKFYTISELNTGLAEIQLIGKITEFKEVKGQKGSSRLVAIFEDKTGILELVWFKNYSWIQSKVKTNEEIVVFGRIQSFGNKFSVSHPEIEKLESFKLKTKTLEPVYSIPETFKSKRISSKTIQKWINTILTKINFEIDDFFSEEFKNNYGLIGRYDSFLKIHFPQNLIQLNEAENRLKFEEFFFFDLSLKQRKIYNKKKNISYPFTNIGHYVNDFYTKHLPFKLTNAQIKVIKEIRNDLRSEYQMNRLLQGDVGSGKTIVALISMLIALDNNYQCCLMAPTEILANQHFTGISKLVNPLNINIKLLTGSTNKKERNYIFENLENGEIKILIGTHALIEDTVKFKNLGLSIIDEQHRFGVQQRAKLIKKNKKLPHNLVMTATPIPRSLMKTVYGDLDLSIIDELPTGRLPIKTFHKKNSHRLEVISFIKSQILIGRQIYVVYPLIEESSTLDLMDLMDGYESLSRDFPLPEYKISILHGKMKPADKAYEMERFIKGDTQIMVATTVIEVGVNVPNASVMVIESSERFGLSQLHQLRGRVGRDSNQSFCILMTKDKLSDEANTRIKTMVRTNDGFEIANVDLQLRGPGNVLGTEQSGVLPFKLASITKDQSIFNLAQKAVDFILTEDINLDLEKNKKLKYYLQKTISKQTYWSTIG
ncbi:MAG: ATP-dependent DNA helicase RecG [Solirubrobacteraceae bacterium]